MKGRPHRRIRTPLPTRPRNLIPILLACQSAVLVQMIGDTFQIGCWASLWACNGGFPDASFHKAGQKTKKNLPNK